MMTWAPFFQPMERVEEVNKLLYALCNSIVCIRLRYEGPVQWRSYAIKARKIKYISDQYSVKMVFSFVQHDLLSHNIIS